MQKGVSTASRPKWKWAKVYEGPIIRIMDFGAVIQLLPGRDGLLHISQIANERVNAVTDFFRKATWSRSGTRLRRPGAASSCRAKCCLTSRLLLTMRTQATHRSKRLVSCS